MKKDVSDRQNQFANAMDVQDLERVRDLMHDLSVQGLNALLAGRPHEQAGELDQITVDDFVRQQNARERTSKMVNMWVQVMLGVDATEISAWSFIDYCARGGGLMQMRSDSKHGGQYLRFRKG